MFSLPDFNLKELPLLGQGTQGKVYRIDSHRCIKIFKSKRVCRDEFETLMMGQGDKHFPRLYGAGEDYIIRECINGIELNKYLSSQQLSSDISNKLLELYESMWRAGFTRLDTAIFHIFVTPSGDLKLIDTAKAVKKKTKYPGLILSGLKELGYQEEFLNFVQHKRPDLYRKWIKHLK